MAGQKISLPAEVDLVGVKNLNKIVKQIRDAELSAPVAPTVRKSDINAFSRSVRDLLKDKSFNLKLGNPVGVRGFITKVRQAINQSAVDINISKANLKNFSKDLQEKAGSVIEPNLKLNAVSVKRVELQLQKFFRSKSIPLSFRAGGNLSNVRRKIANYFEKFPINVVTGKVRVTSTTKQSLKAQFRNVDLPINARISNTEKLLKDIQIQLAARDIPITVSVQQKGVGAATKDVRKLEGDLKKTTVATKQTKDAMVELGEQTALTFRRFGIYTLVTAAFFKFTSAARTAAGEAIEFNDELVKIRQVTGESASALSSLTGEIDRLSTGLGVSSKELLGVSRTLSQAGFSLSDTKAILESIAQSDLAATFDSMEDTIEGVVAITSQFNIEADKVSESLGSINAVSKQFAVESADLITTVRKTGGAFQAAGGNLEELIALFTSVRSTTRESADSIATGFRTIFTRIQRSRTQEFLADLNIRLRDFGDEAESLGRRGLFVGPFESIERLSGALSQISGDDPRFAQITEELGGFRQVSKVIPLIQQYTKAQQALAVAEAGRGSLIEDAIVRQESLANQFTKTREEFQKLIRGFLDTTFIKSFISGLLSITNALIGVAEAAQKVLVPLSLLATAKLAPSIAGITRGIGGSLLKRNSGGPVPGVGNKDSVNALLTPGEYVLRKEAVKKIGVGRLDELNRARFQTGGFVGKAGAAGVGLAASAVLVGFSDLSEELKSLVTSIGIAVSQFALFSTFLKTTTDSSQLKTILRGAKAGGVDRDSLIKGSRVESQDAQSFLGDRAIIDLGSALKRNNKELERQREVFKRLQTKIGNVRSAVAGRRASPELDEQEQKNKEILAQREQEIQVAQESIRAKKAEILAARDQVKEFRKARFAQTVQTSIIAVSGALLAFGSFLESRSKAQIEELRAGGGDQDAARRNFVGGATASGVGTGALSALAGLKGLTILVPALAAFATGPVLAAVGIIGGIGFGIYSFFKSTEDFNRILQETDIEKIKSDFESTFKDLEENRITAGGAGGRLGAGAQAINRQIVGESDPELRKSLEAAIKSNAIQLNEFVNDVAKASGTMAEFEAKVPLSVLQLLSTSSNQTVDALKTVAAENIKNAQAAAKLETQTKKLSREYEVRIREEQALTDVLSNTVSRVGAVATSLTDFPDLQNTVGNQLQNPNAIFDIGGFQKRLSNLTGAFTQSDNLEKSILDTVKATQALPGILLSAQTADPFGDSGDARTFISDELSRIGIGQATKDAIITQISGIIGAEAKDANLFKELDEDFTGTIQKITKDGIKFAEPLSRLGDQLNNELSSLAQSLSTVRQNFDEIINLELEKVDTRDFLVGIRESIEGSPLLNLRQQNLNRRQNILTGGRSGQELLQERQRLQESLRGINEDIRSGAGDPAEQQKLVNLQSKQVEALSRVNRGLDFLGDTAQRSSVLQSKLNEEIEKRQKLSNIADDLVFGSREDREEIIRTLSNVKLADEKGINAVAGDERGRVLSFLESAGTATVPVLGKGADKILQDIRKDALGEELFNKLNEPSNREKKLQDEIERIAGEGNEIRSGLQAGLLEENKRLITTLNSEFTSFIQDLRKTMIESQNRVIDQQIGGLRSSLSGLLDINNAGRLVRQETGLDPAVAKNNLQAVVDNTNQRDALDSTIFNLQQTLSGLNLQEAISVGREITGSESGRVTLNEEKDLSAFTQKVLENVGTSQDTIQEVLSKISAGGLNASIDNGQIRLIDAQKGIVDILKNIQKDTFAESRNVDRVTADIRERIGEDNFAAIANNSSRLTELLGRLPADASFTDLSKRIGSLTDEILKLSARKIVNRNSGGFIPGSGNSDTVPAMLTPGEFVLRKEAVKRLGPSYVRNLNKARGTQKFNAGGLVRQNNSTPGSTTTMSIDTRALTAAINRFQVHIQQLSDTLRSIPSEITMRGEHNLNVRFNGAEVLRTMMPQMQEMVVGEITKQMNNMLRQKFPNAGQFRP